MGDLDNLASRAKWALGDQAYMDQVYDAGGTLEQYLAAWGAYHGGGYDSPLIDLLVDPLDRWEGYVTQREALKAFVDEHQLRNILWVTGDVHMCYVGRIERDPSTAADGMWEVCVTSGNTNPLASSLPEEQFTWRSQNGHLPLITFDPEAERVHVELIAEDGTVAHSQALDLS